MIVCRYTITKAMTEHLMFRKRGNVPLAIVRPSIVVHTPHNNKQKPTENTIKHNTKTQGSCWKEPSPGWIDVISSASAVYMAVCKFLLFSYNCVAVSAINCLVLFGCVSLAFTSFRRLEQAKPRSLLS